jgi:hypothetical protein
MFGVILRYKIINGITDARGLITGCYQYGNLGCKAACANVWAF